MKFSNWGLSKIKIIHFLALSLSLSPLKFELAFLF